MGVEEDGELSGLVEGPRGERTAHRTGL